MGWLFRKRVARALRAQHDELVRFVSHIRATDGSELGGLVVMATDIRHAMEASGHQVMDPIVYFTRNPFFPTELSNSITQFQKEGKPAGAAAVMIWLHTMRAGAQLELRQLGRDMWRELSRGFPHVAESAYGLSQLTGHDFNIRGATEIPVGLSPDVM